MRSTVSRRTRPLAAVLVMAVTIAGRPPVVEAAPSSVAPTLLAAQRAADHATHGEGPSGVEPGKLVPRLQALLSHHATLAVRLSRATLTNDPAFIDAAETALVRNINDIETSATPAFGGDAAKAFSSQSQRQTQALFQYAAGVRNDDAAAQQAAKDLLERVTVAQADLLVELSDGRVDRGELVAALRRQTKRLIAQVDAYDAGRYERAYERQRAAFAATFKLGSEAARAAVRVPSTTPRQKLQTALAMLLGEHVELAIDTMRAGATGAADFDAAAGALDANTRDVTAAMDALFGAKRAKQFNEVWADHIDLFVDYTIAVVEDDEETREAVRTRFDGVMRRFGTTLQRATKGVIDARVVTEAMGQHEQQLIDQIEAYAHNDYRTANEQSYGAYTHIRHVARVLGTAFAQAVARDMPRGGSDTGGGGTAAR